MNRRNFLGVLGGLIVVPQFGRFYRQGSGQLWRPRDAYFVHAGAYYELSVMRPRIGGVGLRQPGDVLPDFAEPLIRNIRVPGPATEAQVRQVMREAGVMQWDTSTGAIWRPQA